MVPISVMIAGCGDIGTRVAALLGDDARVYGLRRTPACLPESIIPVQADVTDPAALQAVINMPLDYLVITLTPGERSEERYRNVYLQGTTNLMRALHENAIKPKRVFFISSTSVYAQDDGSMVDETTPTEPVHFSGRTLLAAEQAVASAGYPSTIIRFSGIYGADRSRLVQRLAAGTMTAAEAQQYSNRIHVDDCARVITHLLWRSERDESLDTCYIASDQRPATYAEIASWLHDKEGETAIRGNTGKQLVNKRLLDTGFQFLYPDYRSGYAAFKAP